MVVLDTLPGACLDVDGDGEPSDKCGGMDCDDTEKVLWPSGFRLEKSNEGVNATARNGGTTETSILMGSIRTGSEDLSKIFTIC